jgi:ABC-2 type transport system ATP-binding protein
VLALVELGDRAGSLVRTLSGGMRQRASLACALVHRPRLLLLDEPTVGVDPQLRAAFWTYFRRLARDGTTLIVSSHVMDEAERCDRLGFLRGGRLLAEGNADELRARTGAETLEGAFLQLAQEAGEGR